MNENKLSEPVIIIKKTELQHVGKVNIFHVDGKRVIYQVIVRPSRGNLMNSYMKGYPILNYVPIKLCALYRPKVQKCF